MVAEDHVPYRPLLSEIFKRAAAKEWTMQTCCGENKHFVSDMLAYLEDLNGRFPLELGEVLRCLAGYAPSYGLEEVQELVRLVHDSLLEKVPGEPPHSDAATS
jgi:hypothetical protein